MGGGGMNRAVAGPALDALSRVPLFADLGEDELQEIAGSMHVREFAAGEVVTAEGAGADAFFVVDAGEGEVSVQGEPRATVGPGDYFGEIALMMGAERTATVTAATDLRCFALTPEDFRTVVEGNPAIAWKLLGSTMDKLS